VAPYFIRPGQPVENCFIESFNGKLRDECLNLSHFASLAEAQVRIEAWRVEYKSERPHRGLGQRTRIEYAAALRDHKNERRNPVLRRELVERWGKRHRSYFWKVHLVLNSRIFAVAIH
jgi:hypothetical protein